LAADGVRVNSVHPGIIDTDMFKEFGGNTERIIAAIPMGRVASAQEVGTLVLFLASDEASYCTGQEFVVDGGFKA
jgi:3alpha(or 20beta)-hydroxysteroid dehydrogenase